MKTRHREEARRMRHLEGRSIKEIARLLEVSRSSVSLWVRDIELTPAQHAALLEGTRRITANATARLRTRDGVALGGGASSSTVEWSLAAGIPAEEQAP